MHVGLWKNHNHLKQGTFHRVITLRYIITKRLKTEHVFTLCCCNLCSTICILRFFSDFKKRVFTFFISRLKNVKSRLPKFSHRSFKMSSQLRFCFILYNFLPFVSYNPYLLLWLANFSWHWIAYNMLMCCLERVSSFLTAHQHIIGHFSAMLSRSCSPTHAELTEWYLKLHVRILRFFQNSPKTWLFRFLSCRTRFLEHWLQRCCCCCWLQRK